MIRKNITLLIITVMVLSCGLHNASGQEKLVSAATLLNFAPHTFPLPGSDEKLSDELIPPGTDSKRLQGYAWDIFRESFHAMGYTIELRMRPWKRCLDEVKSGKTDIVFPASWNQERDQIYDYSTEKLNEVEYVIFYPNERDARNWRGLSSLAGKTILKIRGYTLGSVFDNNRSFIHYEVNSIEQAVSMLKSGRGDAFAGYRLVHGFQLRQLGLEKSLFATRPFAGSLEFALTKKESTRGNRLLDIFSQGKRLIAASGQLAEIDSKWFQ